VDHAHLATRVLAYEQTRREVKDRMRLEGRKPSYVDSRSVMLGLHAPQTVVLKIVDEAMPKETSADKILLAEFAAQKKEDVPTTH
jgi:hypothetical protein